MNQRLTKITTIGVLSAVAFVVTAVGRIAFFPAAPFLHYEAKDVIIAIGGFMFGPLASLVMSLLVAFLEMITVSSTGVIGMIMNVLAASSFACTASFIYKKKQTMAGAVIGLITGVVALTVMMLMWNYFITPYYMLIPRETIAGMLIPVFLPFNLIKGGLNTGIALLIYKPIVGALRAAKLVPPSAEGAKGKVNWGVVLAAVVIIVTCILVILSFNGII